jgi:hypothetical protein
MPYKRQPKIGPEPDRLPNAEALPKTGKAASRVGVPTEQLPPEVKQEAEKTISEDFLLNLEGWLVWDFEEIPVEDIIDLVDLDALEQDESYDLAALADDIKRRGIQVALVVGPSGLEGNHRLAAASQAGLETVPVWSYRVVEDGAGAHTASLVCPKCKKANARMAHLLSSGEPPLGECPKCGSFFLIQS